MDNTIDSLKIKIAKAREELSKETRDAIDAINWKSVLLTMESKYNNTQMEALETETELLLCGLVETENYPKELETRMMLPSSEVNNLINELDKLIFKKIQAELERIIDGKEKTVEAKKDLVYDPRFSNTPSDTQNAIARSNWKEKLYKIGQKYNLAIDKLGLLEDITANVLAGKIQTNKYEEEIKSKITISEDKIKDFISEINTFVFMGIKDIMRNNPSGQNNLDQVVPLPPYKKVEVVKQENVSGEISIGDKKIPSSIKSEDFNLDDLKTNDSDMYREHGIEIISEKNNAVIEKNKIASGFMKERALNKFNIMDNGGHPENQIVNNNQKPVEQNIISDKLFNKTLSQTTTVDYSIPKINTPVSPVASIQGNIPAKPHDPYHEQI
jgi:hypothetical protein